MHAFNTSLDCLYLHRMHSFACEFNWIAVLKNLCGDHRLNGQAVSLFAIILLESEIRLQIMIMIVHVVVGLGLESELGGYSSSHIRVTIKRRQDKKGIN